MLVILSAILAALLLAETSPRVEDSFTVAQRLIRAAQKLVDKFSTRRGTISSRIAQTADAATTELHEDDDMELQTTQTLREANENCLENETKTQSGMTYTRRSSYRFSPFRS